MKYGRAALLFLSFFVMCGSIPGQAYEPALGTATYKMGDVELIAVFDNMSERSRELLLGDVKRIEELMPAEKSVGSVNTYVLKTKKSITLIDTGWGAPRGRSLENLKNIGITPDKIDTILLTHLHGDHVSGLLSEGKAVFPKAKIYLAAAERAYWFDDGEMNKFTDQSRFTIARQAISAYGGRVMTFEPGAEVIPGITAINQTGHTPGHVGYLVKSKNKKMLIWGDLTHFTEVQTAAPEIAVRFDIDPTRAIAARQAILEWVARENIPVAGMHVLFPGVGRIHARGDGYFFEPLDILD